MSRYGPPGRATAVQELVGGARRAMLGLDGGGGRAAGCRGGRRKTYWSDGALGITCAWVSDGWSAESGAWVME
jgi:hypothetical protein